MPSAALSSSQVGFLGSWVTWYKGFVFNSRFFQFTVQRPAFQKCISRVTPFRQKNYKNKYFNGYVNFFLFKFVRQKVLGKLCTGARKKVTGTGKGYGDFL
jgi:hypothetical protein